MRSIHRPVLLGLWAALGMVFAACQPGGPMQGPPGCQNLAPGDFECMIGARTFLLHVPASYTGQTPVPLVLDFHGFTSTADAQRRISGWLQKSDQQGFVVAYPQGQNNAHRTQGLCCGNPDPNDPQFHRAIVTQIRLAGRIDPGRIFATGLSNGGAVSHTLACTASDLFVAVAPVSFQLAGGGKDFATTVANCNPPRPVAVIHFHGTADNVAPYANGVLDSLGSLASLEAWRQVQSCNPNNVDTRFTSNTVCERHSGCEGGAFVSLCTVQGGAHVLYPSVSPTGMTIPDIAYPMLLEFADIDPR